jgi:hypothetical protein
MKTLFAALAAAASLAAPAHVLYSASGNTETAPGNQTSRPFATPNPWTLEWTFTGCSTANYAANRLSVAGVMWTVIAMPFPPYKEVLFAEPTTASKGQGSLVVPLRGTFEVITAANWSISHPDCRWTVKAVAGRHHIPMVGSSALLNQ